MPETNTNAESQTHAVTPALCLDEPQAGCRRPVTGTLLVKCHGQDIHASDELEASVSAAYVRYKIADILDFTRRAGGGHVYLNFQVDVTNIAPGPHSLKLKLIRGGKEHATLETTLRVDHELGYASDYERWMEEIERPGDEIATHPPRSPRLQINVVILVGEGDPGGLRDSVDSVLRQTWTYWALVLVCTSSATASLLEKQFGGESRISVLTLDGSADGVNASLIVPHLPEEAYSCFLKPGERLAARALAYSVTALDDDPETDLIYADHDFIGEGGQRCQPVFKPDWSPDLLLSTNYILDVLAVRNRILAAVGTFRIGRSAAADYVNLLGLTARCAKIGHIDKVLYHKSRQPENPLPAQAEESISCIGRALEEHCARRGAQVKAETGIVANTWRVRYPITEPVPVSIVIASGGRLDVLEANLDSLSATSYLHFEVVVVDNSSDDRVRSLTERRQSESDGRRIRYLDWRRKAFNYSEINNVAARQCSSPLLLFLNDDISVISPGWLQSMVELAIRPEVGAVGAKLLYPNGRIQHAGIAVGVRGTAAHVFRGMDDSHHQCCNLPDVIRNVSAVTGACLMVRASVFWEVGGFDADKLPVDFNDLDLCLKLGSRGYRVLYTPYATLYHYESLTRSGEYLQPDLQYVAEIRSRWAHVVAHDPFYNSNLTREDVDYSLRNLGLDTILELAAVRTSR